MSNIKYQISNVKGVSLVELVVVVAAVGILVFLIANIPNSMRLIGKARHESLAKEIASKAIEDIRAIQYINLANGEEDIVDSRITSDLPSGKGKKLIEDCKPEICTQGELAKEVTVTISWRESGGNRSVKLKTLISQGGLSQ